MRVKAVLIKITYINSHINFTCNVKAVTHSDRPTELSLNSAALLSSVKPLSPFKAFFFHLFLLCNETLDNRCLNQILRIGTGKLAKLGRFSQINIS